MAAPGESMFSDAVPPSLQGIERARHILARIREAGREDLLAAQLAEGMFDCAAQLRTVGIFALRATYPLTGQAWPKEIIGGGFPEGPEGLDARLALAAEQVKALAPADFEGAEARIVTHKAGDADLAQAGREYLTLFALPNLWFHLSMAFAIARSGGLDIGKADYDGWHSYAPGFSFVR